MTAFIDRDTNSSKVTNLHTTLGRRFIWLAVEIDPIPSSLRYKPAVAVLHPVPYLFPLSYSQRASSVVGPLCVGIHWSCISSTRCDNPIPGPRALGCCSLAFLCLDLLLRLRASLCTCLSLARNILRLKLPPVPLDLTVPSDFLWPPTYHPQHHIRYPSLIPFLLPTTFVSCFNPLGNFGQIHRRSAADDGAHQQSTPTKSISSAGPLVSPI